MKTRRRPTFALTLFTILAIAAVLIGSRYIVSAHTTLPSDMPRNAKYVPAATGTAGKLHNRGEWVSCHYDLNQVADLCRVTNQTGVTVFEGRFLPAGSDKPLPDAQLHIASFDPSRHWIPSPTASFPVPVLPLENGAVLVPADDSHPLATRWKSNPEELAAIKRAPKAKAE